MLVVLVNHGRVKKRPYLFFFFSYIILFPLALTSPRTRLIPCRYSWAVPPCIICCSADGGTYNSAALIPGY
ncbi:hypothetical protein F5Y11DRAFT_248058 [Daldinia sp. FL1419]|nr:hypothetical protein F5Y11DRAFT_248058 [Daldinia sp. FL1419]